jgi:hypothetical protein
MQQQVYWLLSSWSCLWPSRAVRGPKHQLTQLTPILPRFGQKRLLCQTTPFGARSALMGSSNQMQKPNTSWHEVQNWPRTPQPPYARCTKLVQKLHTALSWPLLWFWGIKDRDKGKRSGPGESPLPPLNPLARESLHGNELAPTWQCAHWGVQVE